MPHAPLLVLGEPRVNVADACNLHKLLINRHLRGNSPDDVTMVREKRNAQATKRRSGRPAVVATDIAPDEQLDACPVLSHARQACDLIAHTVNPALQFPTPLVMFGVLPIRAFELALLCRRKPLADALGLGPADCP
jgi:hypothetical protein